MPNCCCCELKLVIFIKGSSTASSGSQLLYNQDAVMNQTFAAQHPMILNQMGVNDQSMLLSTKPSLLAVSLEKANAENVVQQVSNIKMLL